MVIEYDDLVKVSDVDLKKYCKLHLKMDISNDNEKWLGLSYYYARNVGRLSDYKARSFASTLTTFITNEIIETGVELVYREDMIDSFLYPRFSDMEFKQFVKYMVQFYKSRESWQYERQIYSLNFRLTEYEVNLLESVPRRKKHDKFIRLIDEYDDFVVKYERVGGVKDKVFAIKLTQSEYEYFMSVRGSNKTDKLVNMLYSYLLQKR